MSRAWHGGKGDWIPGTNDATFHEHYPEVDWDRRAREARGCKGVFVHLTSMPPKPAVLGCTCGQCESAQ